MTCWVQLLRETQNSMAERQVELDVVNAACAEVQHEPLLLRPAGSPESVMHLLGLGLLLFKHLLQLVADKRVLADRDAKVDHTCQGGVWDAIGRGDLAARNCTTVPAPPVQSRPSHGGSRQGIPPGGTALVSPPRPAGPATREAAPSPAAGPHP